MPIRASFAIRLAPLVVVIVARCVANTSPVGAEPPASPAEMLEDAELTDVHFADPDRGWAVGDRGVIWRTEDGGRNWKRPASPTACRLESVCFVDALHGWTVGGWIHPYTHVTTGVVLGTRDGGIKWSLLPAATLPALTFVRFVDEKHGWAVGRGSAMYPAGIFFTDDGGRSWSPIPTGSGSWTAADFTSAKQGAVVGRDGALAFVVNRALQSPSKPLAGLRTARRLRLSDRSRGWLVGDDGLVRITTNGGAAWQPPAAAPPRELVEQLDFAALALFQQHCWIAGAPGSCVLHTGDGGASWDVFSTSQSLPLRGLTFLDENRGWGVGALGTILATRDGGRTWRRQRGGGARAAVLGLFSDAERVPLELFAQLCGNDGYLGVVEVLCHRDLESPPCGEMTTGDRTVAALAGVGVSATTTASHFPLRQSGLILPAEAIVAGWDQANNGRGVERLEEHVVRKIRQWRPEIIATESANAPPSDQVARLTNQLVLESVRKAADASAYPAQLAAGLEPWNVKKVFSGEPRNTQGALVLNAAQLAPRLGRSLGDATLESRSLLASQYAAGPTSLGFRLLIDHAPQDLGGRDFFSGLVVQPGSDARRTIPNAAARDLADLNRAAQKQRNVQQLFLRSTSELQNSAAWLAQIEDLTRGLPEASAAAVLFQLGQRYHQSGKPDLASEALNLLVERHPQNDLTEAALLCLVQSAASSEMLIRLPENRAVESQLQATHDSFAASNRLVANGGRATSAKSSSAGRLRAPADVRAKLAVAWVEKIQRTRPNLYAAHELRFPLAAIDRRNDRAAEAERYYRSLLNQPRHDGWDACAAAELSVASSEKGAAKNSLRCVTAKTKPRLDGRLDDELWKTARVAELRSALDDDSTWPALVMLAHDNEFLYVAASCRKAAGAPYPTTDDPRPRDSDLDDRDRLDLFIDLDRDYTTFFRLTVDHRGWTGEACVGDITWNPEWFVAADDNDETWTIEAAIPIGELTRHPPQPRDVWAVGIQRTVPQVGFQSWTQPAAIRPQGQGFGHVVFE